jgi:hypothetical protein
VIGPNGIGWAWKSGADRTMGLSTTFWSLGGNRGCG